MLGNSVTRIVLSIIAISIVVAVSKSAYSSDVNSAKQRSGPMLIDGSGRTLGQVIQYDASGGAITFYDDSLKRIVPVGWSQSDGVLHYGNGSAGLFYHAQNCTGEPYALTDEDATGLTYNAHLFAVGPSLKFIVNTHTKVNGPFASSLSYDPQTKQSVCNNNETLGQAYAVKFVAPKYPDPLPSPLTFGLNLPQHS
jgi:hypothetical protein